MKTKRKRHKQQNLVNFIGRKMNQYIKYFRGDDHILTTCGTVIAMSEFLRPIASANHPMNTVPITPPMPRIEPTHAS